MKLTLSGRDSAGRSVARSAGRTLSVLLLLLSVGCASTKIDWSSRIGNYTYDQAVIELGPPDKYAKLTDGTVVAEWMTRRGYSRMDDAAGIFRRLGQYVLRIQLSLLPSSLALLLL